MSIGVVVLVLVGVGILYFAGLYNRLTTLRNQVKNAWSQIDVQLQRRYDLIPNLVETVKGTWGMKRHVGEPWFRPGIRPGRLWRPFRRAGADGRVFTAAHKR